MIDKKNSSTKFKTYGYTFLFLLSFLISGKCSFAQPSSDYEKIMDHVRENIWGEVHRINDLGHKVAIEFRNLQKNGSWSDILYSGTNETNWRPFNHLIRVERLAKAYTMPESKFYQDNEIQHAIIKALRFWNKKKPHSSNWWHNDIASPKKLGEILILLRDGKIKLPQTLERKLLKQMNKGNIKKKTGANKLDIAIHYIYRGCLLANAKILQTGVSEAFYPIRFSKNEGLKNDFSYMQHGPQLQISSYGLVFIRGEVKVAGLLEGTSYALGGKKLRLLSNYIRKTYLNVLRGHYVDFSVMGRAISRTNNVDKEGFAETLRKFRTIDDPDNKEIYDEALARLTGRKPPGYKVNRMHKHYWQSDFTLHKRAKYNFSVRMSSTRTERTENGNGENLKGYFLADGATNILVNGNEYYNIFPVWDWNKIPGVTSTEIKPIPKRKSWGTQGTSTFAGGLSDRLYGVSTYALRDYGISANKGWFFFDNEVVCLGSNISGFAKNRVVTTVNQSLLDGKIMLATDKGISKVSSGKQLELKNAHWVLHDSVGYFFPKDEELNLSSNKQTGSWYAINHTEPKKKITKNVFKLWFSHGEQPKNESYAYVIVPGITTVSAMKKYNTSNIKILESDDNIQAVKQQKLDILQLIFYKRGTFSQGNMTVKVDEPCIVQIKKLSKSKFIISASDPSQEASSLKVSLKLPAYNTTKHIKLNLPHGSYRGSTVTKTIK